MTKISYFRNELVRVFTEKYKYPPKISVFSLTGNTSSFLET